MQTNVAIQIRSLLINGYWLLSTLANAARAAGRRGSTELGK